MKKFSLFKEITLLENRYCFRASVDRDKCDKLNLSLSSIKIFVRFLFYFTILKVKYLKKIDFSGARLHERQDVC